MILKQIFNEPINSMAWNWGPKKIFNWRIEGFPRTDSKGTRVRIGSWEANCWFYVALGRSDKQTLSNARRSLSDSAKKNKRTCTFEYID